MDGETFFVVVLVVAKNVNDVVHYLLVIFSQLLQKIGEVVILLREETLIQLLIYLSELFIELFR